MDIFLFLAFLGIVVWIGLRFSYYYKTAEAKTMWGRVIEAAGDSRTYFVAKFGMFLSALLGLAGTGAQFLATTPEAQGEVRRFFTDHVTNPLFVAIAGLVIMAIVWWARSSHPAPKPE